MSKVQTNADQAAFWGEAAGPIWVRNMQAMDVNLAPVLDHLLARTSLRPGHHVMDVGCGAGTSSFAVAELVGPQGSVLGADISETLLAAANARNTHPNVSFKLADVQTHEFGANTFDHIISRFGVMFFEDPVAAFTNMRYALKPEGQLSFAAWSAIPENPFFTLPARVAKSVIGAVPKSDPDAPGPFSFRDADKVRNILQAAGYKDISVDEVQMDLTVHGGASDLAELMCEIGPAQRALSHFGSSEADKARLITALVDAITVFETPKGLRIPALLNYVSASNG